MPQYSVYDGSNLELPPSLMFDFSLDSGFASGGGGGFNGYGGTAPGGGISFIFPSGGGGSAPRPPSTSQTLTAIVNEFERQMQANLAAWQQQQRSAESAISTGWQILDAMVSACYRYGAEGMKAAAERDRRIDPGRLRWDWAAYYIDPITGAVQTPAPPPPVPGAGTGVGVLPIGGAGTFIPGIPDIWLLAGAVLVYLAVKR